MERIDIKNSIEELCKSNKLDISQVPTFSFGTKEECELLIKTVMLEVDKTIKEFKFLPEYSQVADYLSNTKGQGLFMVGSVGRGKSVLAEKVIPVLFKAAQNKIVSVYHALALGNHLNEAIRKKFIVIDDVGIESIHNNYGSKTEPFADLIAMAERNSAVVYITTNLTSQQLINRYGERIIGRIEKLCRIVKFEGKSLRR